MTTKIIIINLGFTDKVRSEVDLALWGRLYHWTMLSFNYNKKGNNTKIT